MSRLSVSTRPDPVCVNSKLFGQKNVVQYDKLHEDNRELRKFGIQASRDAQEAEDELKKAKIREKSLLAEVNFYRARERKTTRTVNPQPGMLDRLQRELDDVKTAALVKNEKNERLQRHLVEIIREGETHNAALITLKNEQWASLEKERQRNAELEEKMLDYQTHNASLQKMYDALKEHTGNLDDCFRHFEDEAEDTKEQNDVLQAALKKLRDQHTQNLLWLAKAQAKVHELENAKAEVVNDDLGAKLHKLKLTGVFCPISMDLLIEDAVVAPDGHSYNEKALQEWFKRNKTSPITRQEMSEGSIKNRALMTVIQELMNLMKPVSDTGVSGSD